jgi:4-amino-4-deoxy-L-arabinose transferase-like glycosyltransferase
MIPLGSRPFIGGSTTGSPLDLIFGYDGLGRILGSVGPGGGGGGFGGTAGLLRLFNAEFFGQIAWLIPLALASLAVGLWLRRRASRTDRGLASYLLWGSTVLTQGLVFSFMSGVIHSYYAVALAPGIAVLVGAGLADLWALRSRTSLGAIALGAAFIGTALWGMVLLERTPDFLPALGPVAVALAAVASAVLLAASAPQLRATLGRAAPAAAALGLVAALLAPAAYSLATVQSPVSGSDPHPGPASAVSDVGGAGGGPGGFAGGAGPGTGSADSALVSYLVAHQGGATWIVAASSAQNAATIELASGKPVMAMGGFTGSDPAPTLAQVKQDIASGRLRYVLDSGGSGRGSGSATSSVSSWVTSTCKAVDYSGSGSSSLYDCAGAVS